jgi:hypothetical protein
VGEEDEEIGTFVTRLAEVTGRKIVVIDNWCGALVMAHGKGYLEKAQQFYQLLFPSELKAKFKVVILTRLCIEVKDSVLYQV